MTTTTAQTTQVYSVFIRATPEQVWEAITKPEFTEKYFFGSRVELTEARYHSVDGEGRELVTGAVLELDPPRRLSHAWRALYDAETAAEDESRVTWEVEPAGEGVSKLTVVHDRLESSTKTAASVATGWPYVLSSLKTLLETGQAL